MTKQEIIEGHISCTCNEAYTKRKLTDPDCVLCNYVEEIGIIMDENLREFVTWFNENHLWKIPNCEIGKFNLLNK